MRIFSLLLLTLALASCGEPDNSRLAEAEADGALEAADSGKLDCALAGATRFSRICEVERLVGSDGVVLIIRHPDGGFRRFNVLTDGRGLAVADGFEEAKLRLLDDSRVEVTVADDRYRLPAQVKGAGE